MTRPNGKSVYIWDYETKASNLIQLSVFQYMDIYSLCSHLINASGGDAIASTVEKSIPHAWIKKERRE